EVAEFGCPTLDAGGDEGECTDEFRVEVALDDLSGNGRGTQPQFPADKGLNLWGKMRAGANRAGKFADGNGLLGSLKPLQGAAKLVIHQGHFQAKGRWLGVNAVAAANHGSEPIFLCLARDDFPKGLHVLDENVRL